MVWRKVELPVLPTSVIGSYPRPKWLREFIAGYREGRYKEEQMREAFDDAVIAVLNDHREAGVDIPTDGEMRRDEMVEYFAERIEGFRFYGPVRVWGNNYFRKPAVVSKLRYGGPMIVDEFLFTRKVAYSEVVKVTITGPYTIADWSFNEYYPSKEDLTFEIARIINREIKALEEAGAIYVQVDEPALTTHPEEIEWAVEAVNEAVRGVNIKVGLHVCYSDYGILRPYYDRLNVSQFALEFANRGFRDLDVLKGLNKELGFGVVDVHSRRVETPEEVAAAIRKVMEFMSPECLFINPDCGLKLLPRKIARQKLKAMVEGARIVRKELRRKGLEKVELRKELTCP